MKYMKGMLVAAVMIALAPACVADEQGNEEVSEADSALTVPMEAPSLRSCWDAGLYWNDCDSSVREMIPQGRQLDYLGYASYCSGEWRYLMVHHATGHQGWVRQVAVCN